MRKDTIRKDSLFMPTSRSAFHDRHQSFDASTSPFQLTATPFINPATHYERDKDAIENIVFPNSDGKGNPVLH